MRINPKKTVSEFFKLNKTKTEWRREVLGEYL